MHEQGIGRHLPASDTSIDGRDWCPHAGWRAAKYGLGDRSIVTRCA